MPSLEVSQIMMYGPWYPFTCNDDREVCMILSIKLHTLEVTLSSMTLRVLNLVQLRNWRLLGGLLKRSQQKLSWRINCMQFGISGFIPLQYCLTWLPVGTVYPWIALVPFYLQNLNSSIKGQAEVSPNEFISHLAGFREILYPPVNWPKFTVYWLVNLHSSFGGYIHKIWWSNSKWICQFDWFKGWRWVGESQGNCWNHFSESLSS